MVNENFLKFLKENKGARKIFGQRELKIIEKQLWGIKLTQSEKNRLSRDIRKKLMFIQKIARFEDEFGLKKGSEIKRLIDDALEVIKEHELFYKIKKIFIFGSTAEDSRTFRSDIDIAVVFVDINDKDAGKFRIHILGRVNDKVDVQVYNILPGKVKKEIDEKGKILYERKNK